MKFEESVTCCDFAPMKGNGKYTLAIGFANGDIKIIQIKNELDQFELITQLELSKEKCHAGSIKRLKWRRGEFCQENQFLASCSEDHSLKITCIGTAIFQQIEK